MISPIGKRRWWFLVMVAMCFLAASTAQEVGAGQQRTLAFPAFSLASDPASVDIVRVIDGLRWKYNYAAGAYLILPRPPDWNGTSDIQIRFFFRPMTTGSGTVRFFVRPQVYDPGDDLGDTSAVLSEFVSVSNSKVSQATISIPVARVGVKSWWRISIQRDSPAPTYLDDVVIMSVVIDYTAISPLTSTFLPSVIK